MKTSSIFQTIIAVALLSYTQLVVAQTNDVPKKKPEVENTQEPSESVEESIEITDESLDETEVTGTHETPLGPVEGYKASYSSTATKSDIPIIDVPASVQVVPREVIEDQNAIRLFDAVRNVSGVQNSGTSGNRSDGFSIRGFSSARLLRDGFPSPVSFGDVGFMGTSNLERVEVLKGPASVLFGLVEPGGAINLVTKKPQALPFYRTDLTYGSYDFYRSEIDLNQPLLEDGSLLFRLSGEYQNSDSFRDYFSRYERTQFAPSLRWMPSPDTTIDVQLQYYEQSVPGDRGIIAIDGRADALPRERYLGETYDVNRADDILVNATVYHEFSEDWNWNTSVRGSWSSTAPVASYPYGLVEGSDRLVRRDVYDFSQEISNYALQSNLTGKFDTGFIGHDVLVGVDANTTRFVSLNRFASMEPIDVYNPVYGTGHGTWSARSRQDRDHDFYGIYLQDLLSFGEHWKVLLGGRYDFTSSFYGRDGATRVDSTAQEFSPRAGLVYQPIEDLSIYASYTESFSPNLFSSNADNTPFDPEYGKQFEVGVKRDWFDGALSTTLAAYDLTRTNLATSDPTNPFYSIQTGEQSSRGLELDVSGEILPGWNVYASLAYMDAELTADNDLTVGKRLANAPEWSGSVWTTYSFAHGPLRGLELGGGLFGVGERYGSLENKVKVDGYARVDAFARYRINDNLQVSLNVDNVFDDYFIEAPGSTVFVPGAPRSVFLKVSLDF